MTLREIVDNYSAHEVSEIGYVDSFRQFMETYGDNIYTRDNLVGHVVVSAFVTNPEHTKVLMGEHKILGTWAWLGGHADGERDLVKVALKEVEEESGLSGLMVVCREPISLEVFAVGEHFKRGKFVPPHLHYNVAFWLEADENAKIHNKPDENKAVKWIAFSEIGKYNNDEVDNKIYQRIIKKIQHWDRG